MFNIKGFEFGEVKADAIRLSHLGIAVKNKVGSFVSYDKKTGEIIDVDMLDLGITGMIYKMPVSIKDIAVSDVILHNGAPMFVISLDGGINVIDVAVGEEKKILPTKNMFGFDFVTKVVSLIDFNTLGASSDSPFGNMLPLLLLGDKKGGAKDLLPLMLLGGTGGANSMGEMFSNPLMTMMLLGDDKGSMKDLLPLMLLGGGNLFGKKAE